MLAFLPSGAGGRARETLDLLNVLVDLGDLSPGRSVDLTKTSGEQRNVSQQFSPILAVTQRLPTWRRPDLDLSTIVMLDAQQLVMILNAGSRVASRWQ
jgi:hypothetical protein